MIRNPKKQLFITSVLLTLIFYTLANGYCFFQSLYAGDSLQMIYQDDGGWEIALGRFVQPFLVLARGAIAAPFLISVLAIIWISLSVYFVVDFLEIKRQPSIVLIAAIMSCNITILSLNATFLPYLDFYALSLFLSVFGVWLMKKEKIIFLVLGGLSLSISLGIYQAYICVSFALVMIYFLYKMPEWSDFKSFFRKAVKYLLSFMAAAVVYYVAWKLFQQIFHIWSADTYNGLASMGDYSAVSIGAVLAVTYENVLKHFLYPETFITNTFRGISMSVFWDYLLRLCNVVVFLVIILAVIKMSRKCKTNPFQKILQALIILLFPLGINFVCVISKGMEHSLMIYAFYFVYILAIKLTELCWVDEKDVKKAKGGKALWMLVMTSVVIVSWSNIVYSNQIHFKRELQENAAKSIMTRMVHEIEMLEDYIPGVTPVGISGNFQSSPCLADVEPFNSIGVYGMGTSVLTYPGANYAFLSYMMNMNMNLVPVSGENEIILQMPVYPEKGSIAYVDGILVIKISE